MSAVQMQPRLLGVVDAAKYLGVSRRTIDELTHKNILTPVALGAKRLYPLDDLDRFADRLPEWETKKSESSERVAS